MRVVLNCAGLSPVEHAAVATAIRQSVGTASVHEVDDQRSRRFDPAAVGAVAGVVSAVCAAVTLVLQIVQTRKDRRAASRGEAEEAMVRVEVTLDQRIEWSVRNDLMSELQKLPEPVRIFLPDGESFYEVSATPGEQLVSIKGQPVSSIRRPGDPE